MKHASRWLVFLFWAANAAAGRVEPVEFKALPLGGVPILVPVEHAAALSTLSLRQIESAVFRLTAASPEVPLHGISLGGPVVFLPRDISHILPGARVARMSQAQDGPRILSLGTEAQQIQDAMTAKDYAKAHALIAVFFDDARLAPPQFMARVSGDILEEIRILQEARDELREERRQIQANENRLQEKDSRAVAVFEGIISLVPPDDEKARRLALLGIRFVPGTSRYDPTYVSHIYQRRVEGLLAFIGVELRARKAAVLYSRIKAQLPAGSQADDAIGFRVIRRVMVKTGIEDLTSEQFLILVEVFKLEEKRRALKSGQEREEAINSQEKSLFEKLGPGLYNDYETMGKAVALEDRSRACCDGGCEDCTSPEIKQFNKEGFFEGLVQITPNRSNRPESGASPDLALYRVRTKLKSIMPYLEVGGGTVKRSAEPSNVITVAAQSVETAPAPSEGEIEKQKQERLERIISFANSFQKIRVYFADAPGFGHQMATLSAVRRLRDIGYAGEIEGVYFDGATRFKNIGDRDVPEKLHVLIPGFKPGLGDEQRIPEVGLTLRSLSAFLKGKTPVSLALTGGFDVNVDPLAVQAKQPSGADPNLADLFNADYFLHLGPLDWRGYTDSIWLRGEKEPRSIAQAYGAGFVYRPYDAPGPERLSELLSASGMEEEKIRGMKALFAQIDRNQHELLPVYGIGHAQDHGEILHRVLLAVSHSLDRTPGLYTRPGGVVLPLLFSADQTTKMFDEIVRDPRAHIANFDRLPPDRQKEVLDATRKLQSRLKISSISDPGLEASLKNLAQDEILLIKTGALPPHFFEPLYGKATLPPTVSGANLTDLLYILGSPMLPLSRSILGTVQNALEYLPIDAAERDRALSFINFRLPNGGFYTIAELLFSRMTDYGFEPIGDYISELRRPGSVLEKAFQASKLDPKDVPHDKLLNSLETLAKLFEAQPHRAPAAEPGLEKAQGDGADFFKIPMGHYVSISGTDDGSVPIIMAWWIDAYRIVDVIDSGAKKGFSTRIYFNPGLPVEQRPKPREMTGKELAAFRADIKRFIQQNPRQPHLELYKKMHGDLPSRSN